MVMEYISKQDMYTLQTGKLSPEGEYRVATGNQEMMMVLKKEQKHMRR